MPIHTLLSGPAAGVAAAAALGAHAGDAQPADHGHGRHQHRHFADPRRPGDGVARGQGRRLPADDAGHGDRGDRRGRRLDRLDGRPGAEGRAPLGRRAAGPRLLRAGRGRSRPCRTPTCCAVSIARCAARGRATAAAGPRGAGDRAARRALGATHRAAESSLRSRRPTCSRARCRSSRGSASSRTSSTLMIYGGAGAIHGPLLADEMGIGHVVVPRLSSVFCAFGGLVSDLLHDGVRNVHGLALDGQALAGTFAALRREGKPGSRSRRQTARRSSSTTPRCVTPGSPSRSTRSFPTPPRSGDPRHRGCVPRRAPPPVRPCQTRTRPPRSSRCGCARAARLPTSAAREPRQRRARSDGKLQAPCPLRRCLARDEVLDWADLPPGSAAQGPVDRRAGDRDRGRPARLRRLARAVSATCCWKGHAEMDPVRTEVMRNRFAAIAEEAATSPTAPPTPPSSSRPRTTRWRSPAPRASSSPIPCAPGVTSSVCQNVRGVVDQIGIGICGRATSSSPTTRSPATRSARHTMDIHLLRPVFRDGGLVAFGWAFIHASDIGGSVARQHRADQLGGVPRGRAHPHEPAVSRRRAERAALALLRRQLAHPRADLGRPAGDDGRARPARPAAPGTVRPARRGGGARQRRRRAGALRDSRRARPSPG